MKYGSIEQISHMVVLLMPWVMQSTMPMLFFSASMKDIPKVTIVSKVSHRS